MAAELAMPVAAVPTCGAKRNVTVAEKIVPARSNKTQLAVW